MRTLNLDLAQGKNPPDVGTHLATARLLWTIHGVDPVDSKAWPNRWRLTLHERRPRPDILPPGTIETVLYRSGETPTSFFGPWRDEDET